MRAKPDSNHNMSINNILSQIQQYISNTHNINRSNKAKYRKNNGTLASLTWTNGSGRNRHSIEEYYSSRNRFVS